MRVYRLTQQWYLQQQLIILCFGVQSNVWYVCTTCIRLEPLYSCDNAVNGVRCRFHNVSNSVQQYSSVLVCTYRSPLKNILYYCKLLLSLRPADANGLPRRWFFLLPFCHVFHGLYEIAIEYIDDNNNNNNIIMYCTDSTDGCDIVKTTKFVR